MASDEMRRVYSAYLNLFESDAGKIVLEDMKKAFCNLSFIPGAMDYKAGQADVVMRVERMMEIARNGEWEEENAE
ncbi:MAG: hypothetical protein FJ088_09755 [Deltaproteobacteria bacterium]|nr:hypothetical protein [Deltaproteobacteria bacterium]